MSKIIPVILSGGSGTRLWPLSRKEFPKQCLPLLGDNTMLQETILRLKGLDSLADPIIVCNVDHRFLVSEQCRQINITNPTILLEPVGRNTAPAIIAAAFQSLKDSDNAVLLVLSADHIIQDIRAFHDAINIATKQAQNGKLVTFGIVPTDANTDYGYIKTKPGNDKCLVMNVESFYEKPNLKVVERYIATNLKLSTRNLPLEFLWNSGMFMFKVDTLIDELINHSPDIVKSVNDAVNNAEQDLHFIRLNKKNFESSPSDSIDYALLEKSNNVVVVTLDAKWSDIGSWSALYDIGDKDSQDNVIKGDVITLDTTNTYINANNHVVAAIGVDNLIIVDTPDATLVAAKEKANEVSNIVQLLQVKRRNEAGEHRKVHRPWGWYDSVESGENFQVKRLYIKPNAKLSLQMHYKRAEHWVVVSGKATVTNGEKIFTLTKGESTFIPLGVKHAIENKTNDSLEIIEVQSGSYLGEDDIVRFEDIYGRVNNEYQ